MFYWLELKKCAKWFPKATQRMIQGQINYRMHDLFQYCVLIEIILTLGLLYGAIRLNRATENWLDLCWILPTWVFIYLFFGKMIRWAISPSDVLD